MEFILQEKFNGYNLRIGGKDFYQNYLQHKRIYRKSWKRHKKIVRDLDDLKVQSYSSSFQKCYDKILPKIYSNDISSINDNLFTRGTIYFYNILQFES